MRTWGTLPPELVALHDAPGGTSLIGLAGILNAYDAWREEQDRPMPPDTGKLCCCGSGQDCPATPTRPVLGVPRQPGTRAG